MKRALRIYLAWTPEQLTGAFRAADLLLQAGHVPVMQGTSPDWSELDRWRLEACDCLVRLPGESPKCDCAVDSAKVRGLPVYFSLHDCLNALPKRVSA